MEKRDDTLKEEEPSDYSGCIIPLLIFLGAVFLPGGLLKTICFILLMAFG
jgi:hypothetical protein